MLGKRDKNHYGQMTLEAINDLIIKENNDHFELEFYGAEDLEVLLSALMKLKKD